MALIDFDASTVQPREAFDVLPPGDYPVMIVNSEERPTKDGNGKYLWLEMQVIDGPQKGRLLWDRLNLNNPNAQAVTIAKQTLSAICHAVGVIRVTDSAQLHNRPMLAKVKTRPADERGDASNEVKGYKPLGGAAPAAFAGAAAAPSVPPTSGFVPPPASAAPAAAPASTTPPWAK
jgi:hypothetical protein